jgi:drug/metabolite transporter (DMT)-like permease
METFDPTKICSVLLIFSGVYLVTTSRSRADAEKSRLQPENPRKRQ